MTTEAKTTNYWVASNALYIQLNATGEPNRIQASAISGASILCYMQGIEGLGYDAGHNYQRWTLAAYPSEFPDNNAKYVYAAIPRKRTSDNDVAIISFPSQRIDIYGKTIEDNPKQLGDENFYYIFLQGIIGEVETDENGNRSRDWKQKFDCGSLATDEALASGGEGQWWKYNSVSDTITFLKTILEANFDKLSAKDAEIAKLILGKKELTGIADKDTIETSQDKVVTPQYLGLFGVKHFLAKDKDDTAQGLITFQKGLTSNGNAQFNKNVYFGEFIQGILTGTGGRVDNQGNAEFESITARSSIIAKELIVNRQTAIESNFFATESGIVESVTKNEPTTEGDNVTYDLKLQKRWDNDFTAFHEQDCLRASINTLLENGKYYDMWLRVLSVNTVSNTITVVCYPDNEVPSGKNYPPCELARLVRWGNPVDEKRQRVWYLSSETGTIVLLNHVTKPIIDRTNYSIAIGLLPDTLSFVFQDYPEVDPEDGAIYTKWIAAQNFVQKDYEGNTKQSVVDRGRWSLDTAKGDKPYRCITTEVHDAWHSGCRWRCLEDKTTAEPKYASTGWAFVEGNPNFSVIMTSENGWDFDCDTISSLNDNGGYDVFTILSFDATLYNRSVRDYVEAKRVTWTRDTGNTKEDNAWAIEHASSGFSVPLTWKDLGTNADERWKCTFKVEVELIEDVVSSNGDTTTQSRKASDESPAFV